MMPDWKARVVAAFMQRQRHWPTPEDVRQQLLSLVRSLTGVSLARVDLFGYTARGILDDYVFTLSGNRLYVGWLCPHCGAENRLGEAHDAADLGYLVSGRVDCSCGQQKPGQ